MSALVVAGTVLKVLRQPTTDGATRSINNEGGDLSRSLSGKQGGAVFWQKDEIDVRLAYMTPVEYAALVLLLAPGTLKSCSGDLIGPTAKDYVVLMTSAKFSRRTGTINVWEVSLKLIEG